MIKLRHPSATVKKLTLSSFQSVALVPVLIMALAVGCYRVDHPLDQVMEEKLKLQQADFDKLINMLKEDSDVVRLGSSFAFFDKSSNRSLSNERMDEYRRLFDKLNLQNGVHRDRKDAIRLIASFHDGLLMKSEKSYVYSTADPSPQVSSLDNVTKTDRGDHAPVFKKVSNNWYLYYESW